jgi:NAD(P)-dependent dehydrogenase (short-subunit alcohol dehydrogenase family)
MVEHGRGGSIVAITSIAAANPAFASNVGYAASKAALDAVVKHVAPRVAPMGVRLNAVGPGITATSMSAVLQHDAARRAAALAAVPMGRLAEPDEIAEAVRFLASDDAAFITGESLYVDGGCFTR